MPVSINLSIMPCSTVSSLAFYFIPKQNSSLDLKIGALYVNYALQILFFWKIFNFETYVFKSFDTFEIEIILVDYCGNRIEKKNQ